MSGIDSVFDVGIIGAGPAGLFSVFECSMVSLSVCVFDALEHIGGQCSALYPQKPIYDIPAHPSITAAELIERLHQQIAPFNPSFFLGESIIALEEEGGLFKLSTDQGRSVQVRSVIIAAGCGAFGPNRPPLEGIEDFEGTSLFYSIQDPTHLYGKNIVIAGGGDSAIDWALELCDRAHVSLVHRRSKFKASPKNEKRVYALSEEGKIDLLIPCQLSSLHGDFGCLTHVGVSFLDGVGERLIPCDVLVPFFGLSMNVGPIANFGLDMKSNHIITNPTTAETSREGIYAVGDISTYPNKRKFILCGFAEATQAAHHIREFLNPGVNFHFEYSTTKGVPEG